MTIRDYIEITRGIEFAEVVLFDCKTERKINFKDSNELMCSKYSDYDICSVDVWVNVWWTDEYLAHFEFNVELNEED